MLFEVWASSGSLNATSFINKICGKYANSRSAAWARFNYLKTLGLIISGSKNNRGRPLELSKLGKMILEVLYAE